MEEEVLKQLNEMHWVERVGRSVSPMSNMPFNRQITQ